MIHRKNNHLYFCFFSLAILFTSCEKENISFGSSSPGTDPNITYFDNYQTTIATYKPDSFLTSSHHTFSLGYHLDPVFGVVKAGSFAQISLPAINPLLSRPAIFDSLELIIKPSGEFYGDSTQPMKINVYRLIQNIKNDVYGDAFYNTSSFNYAPAEIGQRTVSLNGRSGTGIHIRLSDALGQEWLEKFKTNNDDIATAEKFTDYFRGIYINTDSTITRSIAYFSVPADSMLLRMTYHENTLYPVSKQMDFTYLTGKQFSNISFRHTNSNFTAFINNKEQLIESTVSGNQSFLNTALGSSIKITFPSLLNLKELHPYIKVVKALLLVKPDAQSSAFPYQLPKTLNLYTTDNTNVATGAIYEGGSTSSSALQTGDLVVDGLYGENTYYSYDITSFINTKISEGQFSKSALLLSQTVGSPDEGLQRLVINNQSNSRPIQLKLYVLGL